MSHFNISRLKHRSTVLVHLALVVAMMLAAAAVVVPAQVVSAQTAEASMDNGKCPVSPTAKLVWVSPRGTLEVMDDYPLWVAKKLGYFEQMGIDIELQPGPLGGANVMSLLPEKKADVGFPSPGVL